MRHKKRAFAVVVLLACLHLPILFAGFVAPYDPAQQNRDLPYAPPTRIHFFDNGSLHRPFVYSQTFSFDGYQTDTTRRHELRFFVKGSPYKVLGVFGANSHLFGVDERARISVLGTDAYGRDEFSRILWGGQISLAAGLLATILTLITATLIGIISGYCGSWVDESLMGSAELFLSLPWLYFLLMVRALLPLHVSPTATFFLLIGVIGIIGWARPARLVRGIVLTARTHNYVLAARGFGATDSYILRRHIFPETLGVLLTQAALLVPAYVAAEVTLSFFGLGVSEPTPSWGNMMSSLQQYSVLVSYGWLMAPAAALVITSVMYWVLADTIRYWVQSR